ncbi:uncharacterized protein LOC143075025 isoform X1 [Mytilus galloprovincialis]|uniref:uncharacterized protein LOC143075025 isoform X1 n=2 Tax=Mytilus galloprovincialis TaxID=29158 RepID=UPI003F7B8C8B
MEIRSTACYSQLSARKHHHSKFDTRIFATNGIMWINLVCLLSIAALCPGTPLDDKIAITLDGTTYINLHEPINLVCNVTGITEGQIDWFFNGHMIRERDPRWKSRVHINEYVTDVPVRMIASELTLDYSILEDQGHYVCRGFAVNQFYATSLPISIIPSHVADEKEGAVESVPTSSPDQSSTEDVQINDVHLKTEKCKTATTKIKPEDMTRMQYEVLFKQKNKLIQQTKYYKLMNQKLKLRLGIKD